MTRKKKTAAPEPDLEIRADPELIAEDLEPVNPERSHTELMRLRGLGLLPPGEDFIPTSLFVSNNVLTSGMGGDLESDIDASGIASFNIPGKAFTNIEELIVDIVPVQEGSGIPSPDNVRPITGFSTAKVTRTGKNLYDPSLLENYKQSDGTYRLQASASSGIKFYIPSSFIGEQLTFSAYIDNSKESDMPTNVRVICTVSGTTSHGNNISVGNKGVSKITFTPTSANDYVAFSYGSGGSYYFTIDWLQLELGSTATDYEPYNGTSVTIDLDGTRYGGVLDVTRGKLWVTMVGVDMGDIAWTIGQNSGNTYNYFSHEFSDKAQNYNYISSQYPVIHASRNNLENNTIGVYNTTNAKHILCVRDDRYSDATAFENAMSGVQLVYELATPIDVDLTPANINALLGDNNIWADCGPVTKLEYSYDLLINQN